MKARFFRKWFSWLHLGTIWDCRKEPEEGEWCVDQGQKRHRVTRPCNQHWLGEEVWVLILRTCSVTWGCHNLLLGDSERVSLTGGKKQTKTSEKHIKIIVINIHWTLLMSQALFKRSICKNSFNCHNNAPELGIIIIPILKMKKSRHRERKWPDRWQNGDWNSDGIWCHCSQNCEGTRMTWGIPRTESTGPAYEGL